MPKVKKKPASKPRGRRKKPQGFFEKTAALWTRFSNAALAGSVLIALVSLAFLWTGGYVGVFGEKLSRAAGAGAVSAGFEVHRITAMGVSETSSDDILAAVGPVIGTSILHFDPDRARAQIEQIGWVRSAAVSRLLPDTIHVSVRERKPAAIWQLSKTLHLIDDSGAVIREVNAYEYADLPLIVGAGAPESASEILRALQDEPSIWSRTSALIRVSDRRWNVKTLNGVDVKFPESDLAEAAQYLARIQKETGLLDEPLEYVDLRFPDNFVYRRKGDMQLDMPLGQIR